MDQLEHAQREAITRLSTERLRAKLVKAGHIESQLSAMSREQILDAYANAVLNEREQA